MQLLYAAFVTAVLAAVAPPSPPPPPATAPDFAAAFFDDPDGLIEAALGEAVGGYVRRSLRLTVTAEDILYHDQAAANALWKNQAGQATSWQNDRTGVRGKVVPTSPVFWRDDDSICRTFHDSVSGKDGQGQDVDATVCLHDQQWHLDP